MFETFMKQQQERKEQLELMFPEQIVKNISLRSLKKLAYIMDISSYNSKSKRELIHAIISEQGTDEKSNQIFFYEIEDEVYKFLELNVNCNFYHYIVNEKKGSRA